MHFGNSPFATNDIADNWNIYAVQLWEIQIVNYKFHSFVTMTGKIKQKYLLIICQQYSSWSLSLLRSINHFLNDKFQTLPNWKFADNNFKFNENGRNFKWVDKTMEKGEIAISSFPTVFLRLVHLTCKNQGFFEGDRVKLCIDCNHGIRPGHLGLLPMRRLHKKKGNCK